MNVFFWKIFFVSWLGLSYDESFKLVFSYGSTISLVQVLWFAFALCTLALVACSTWFWGSEDSIFVHSSIVHEHWGASSFLFRTLVLDLFDCLSPLWRCLEWLHLISNLWILNIVWFPLTIHCWICAFDFTHILRNAHFMEKFILYWLPKFFFPFRQSMPMGEKFRGFKGNLGFMLLLHLPLMRFAFLLDCHARMLYSLYKPS